MEYMTYENKIKLIPRLSKKAISTRAAAICERENIKHRETRLYWINKGVIILEPERLLISISIKDKKGDVYFINTCKRDELTDHLNAVCKMLEILY
jgi:hypothetical protein